MSNKFHVMRKDGTGLRSVGSLGQAMDEMGAGFLLYMGSSSDAIAVSKALTAKQGGAIMQVIDITAGSLLAIGAEEGPDRHSMFEGGKL